MRPATAREIATLPKAPEDEQWLRGAMTVDGAYAAADALNESLLAQRAAPPPAGRAMTLSDLRPAIRAQLLWLEATFLHDRVAQARYRAVPGSAEEARLTQVLRRAFRRDVRRFVVAHPH